MNSKLEDKAIRMCAAGHGIYNLTDKFCHFCGDRIVNKTTPVLTLKNIKRDK